MGMTYKRPSKVAIAIEVVMWHVGPPYGYSLFYVISVINQVYDIIG